MRVATGRKLRVGPGDEVLIRARLPANSPGLGRLYVFAREGSSDQYSPCVPHRGDIEYAKPPMVSPLAIRLTKATPARELTFVADAKCTIRIMQEVDDLDEPKAKVWLKRNPSLSWIVRLRRRLSWWTR